MILKKRVSSSRFPRILEILLPAIVSCDQLCHDDVKIWILALAGATPATEGVLDISQGGEVRRGPSYPDPV